MKNINLQDFFVRMNYLKNETKIWYLKSIIFNASSFQWDKLKASYILSNKFWRFSKVRVVNRCIVTGRAKSVLRDFWLSRMEFKNYASLGLLPGLKKRNF
jgi:small subunit ribosomal protein S14